MNLQKELACDGKEIEGYQAVLTCLVDLDYTVLLLVHSGSWGQILKPHDGERRDGESRRGVQRDWTAAF